MITFRNKKAGFTLIELLVVIAIIGLLASIVMVNLNAARNKAKIGKTLAELRNIRSGIEMLFDDTGQYPAHIGFASDCDPETGPEEYLDTCTAGLQCTDGGFPNWGGPYMTEVPEDAWGNSYIFDADYTCSPGIRGCEEYTAGGNNNVRAIHSGGPNGSGINSYDSDNIVLVICDY